jgi:hypothetical protein
MRWHSLAMTVLICGEMHSQHKVRTLSGKVIKKWLAKATINVTEMRERMR